MKFKKQSSTKIDYEKILKGKSKKVGKGEPSFQLACSVCGIVHWVRRDSIRKLRKNNSDYKCRTCNCAKTGKLPHGRPQIYESDSESKIYHRQRAYTDLRRRLGILIRSTKSRCKRKGWKTDLDLDFLINLWNSQNGKCAITNFDMLLRNPKGKIDPYAPSLDRIDSSKQYTMENVRLVCVQANHMLSQIGEDLLKEFCVAFLEQYEAKNSTFPWEKTESAP